MQTSLLCQGRIKFQPTGAHRKCPWGEYKSILSLARLWRHLKREHNTACLGVAKRAKTESWAKRYF